LKRKWEAVRLFQSKLLNHPAGLEVAKIVVFGSVALGDVTRESDVDVFVFAAGPVKELDRAAGEAAFETQMELGERVEPLVYSLADGAVPNSPFLYAALKKGKEVYRMEPEELKRREMEALYELAVMYLEEAREKYEPAKESSRRVTVDTAYNAIELCAKALLRDKMEMVPKTHGGVSTLFSDVCTKTGLLPRTFGHRLSTALRYRNQARYDRYADITADKVQEILAFAEEMMEALEEHLKPK